MPVKGELAEPKVNFKFLFLRKSTYFDYFVLGEIGAAGKEGKEGPMGSPGHQGEQVKTL